MQSRPACAISAKTLGSGRFLLATETRRAEPLRPAHPTGLGVQGHVVIGPYNAPPTADGPIDSQYRAHARHARQAAATDAVGPGSWRGQRALWSRIETDALLLAPLDATDVPRLRALMEKYHDLPMDLADAALVRVAQRDDVTQILTLDRSFESAARAD